MPFYDDHPVRLLLLRSGLRQRELAAAAGLTNGAVDKVVMGMTRTPNPALLSALSRFTGVPAAQIADQVQAWNERPITSRLTRRAQATLLLDPTDISVYYPSFRSWREEFAENPTAFASMLRVPRATVKEFEDGLRTVFPPSLHSALVTVFGLSDEYVLALSRLPVSTGQRAVLA